MAKADIKTFLLITGKRLCWSLFLIVLQAFRPATLLKRDPDTGDFLLLMRNTSEHHFEKHHFERLLLKIYPVLLL